MKRIDGHKVPCLAEINSTGKFVRICYLDRNEDAEWLAICIGENRYGRKVKARHWTGKHFIKIPRRVWDALRLYYDSDFRAVNLDTFMKKMLK